MKKIESISIKEIFEHQLGKENAQIILNEIQKESEKGTKGKALQDFAKKTIESHVKASADSRGFTEAAATAATTAATTAAVG
jgi:hypothetical protein